MNVIHVVFAWYDESEMRAGEEKEP